ncbi:metallophosphoesterase [Lolliginicoccus suaedae]|uniref:metallophosphoesterase n=1 Tax=Lolliginicoccus suaedae TaxID=2605429 RepID=UPI0011EE7224|nr:metallophosphoesterase [Lolliginicoccus suaedae]
MARNTRQLVARAALGTVAAGSIALAHATLIERNAFTVRNITVPILPPGTPALRILHLSDLHMTPRQHLKQAWLAELANLEPDLVINTGDNLSHTRAVPSVVQSLDRLLARPGAYVFGSNDYFGPRLKNPLKYFRTNHKRIYGDPLPWQDLRAAFNERGWLDATHTRRELEINGIRIAIAGVDDPHINRDRYKTISGRPDPRAQLRIGLAHSPEPRVLDRFASDGYDLVLAGHTHGGQLCLPAIGALVTNCGIDRSRVKGLSRWGSHMRLHVSAGIGTSPYAPARFFCRPEASLLTLVAAPQHTEPRSGSEPVSQSDATVR